MEFKDALDDRIRMEVDSLYLTVTDQRLNVEEAQEAATKTGPGSEKAWRTAMDNVRWKDGFFREHQASLKQLLWVWEQVAGEKHDRADDVAERTEAYYGIMRELYPEPV